SSGRIRPSAGTGDGEREGAEDGAGEGEGAEEGGGEGAVIPRFSPRHRDLGLVVGVMPVPCRPVPTTSPRSAGRSSRRVVFAATASDAYYPWVQRGRAIHGDAHARTLGGHAPRRRAAARRGLRTGRRTGHGRAAARLVPGPPHVAPPDRGPRDAHR